MHRGPAARADPDSRPDQRRDHLHAVQHTTGSLLRNAASDFDLGLTTEAEREEMVADGYDKLRAVDVEPGSEFEDRLAALEEFDLEDYPRTFSPEGPWADAVAALQLSCENAGAEFYVNVTNEVEG